MFNKNNTSGIMCFRQFNKYKMSVTDIAQIKIFAKFLKNF